MSEHSWAQQETGRFFEARESPTQSKCDDNAHKISGGSTAVAVPDILTSPRTQ
ncbi:predicted protein [Histoplasma mississippiense (nom. inval.)]|uniref:predicted protein n=1 Tax=Ajellomyces capsulatus (strain NAm1 / WU24) TaxID=2059318 RepID=UPI000157CFBF|nr:predicted protein [Histoplasma mississippiense (nom. inval.)]EDN11410.1 predicted protein [Histoplasma mississippiense (nom. inval.)]